MFLFLSLLCASTATAQVQIYNFTQAATGLSSTCLSVLNQVVSCDSSIIWAGYEGHYVDASTLGTLCTTDCASSLSTWRRRVGGACTTRYNDTAGNLILPALWAEEVVENHNVLCLQNSGQFCNVVIASQGGINPANQAQTASANPTATCDDCFLMQLSTQLQMQLLSRPDYATVFSSLTSDCSKTSFSVTPIATTTSYIVQDGTATPTDTPSSCDGQQYTVQSGDTCSSVSTSQGLSTSSLLAANGNLSCNSFPTSGTLCIPSGASCSVYTVQSGDTCASIGDANKLTWTQVVTWNPVVGPACSNIGSQVNQQICISNPGGSWVNPSPTSATPTTSFVMPPFEDGTLMANLPAPTFTDIGSFSGNNTDWKVNYAPGTRTDCFMYANASMLGNSSSCDTVASNYNVTVTDLQNWNPSIPDPCSLSPGLTYCVQRLPTNSSAITSSCVFVDVPDPGTTCDQFARWWGIDVSDFTDWNPSLGGNCENWKYGLGYCVMVAHYKQPGIVSSCNQYAMANITELYADPCGTIETAYGLSHARFVAWNPALQTNCTGIRWHYDYCVSIPGFKPTFTTQSTASPSTSAGT